jgi:beta-glucanase (GH16 family)
VQGALSYDLAIGSIIEKVRARKIRTAAIFSGLFHQLDIFPVGARILLFRLAIWTLNLPVVLSLLYLVGGIAAHATTSTSGKRDADIGPASGMTSGLSGNWQLKFVEEFNQPKLDLDVWTTCYWWNKGGCTNLGARNLSWYLPENVAVADGILQLTARREEAVSDRNKTFPFTSGMVTTGRDYTELPRPPRFEFKYGLVEIRAKIPKGRGLWPALWLLPSTRKSRPEIDIMEVLGDTPDRLRMHYHFFKADGVRRSAGHTVTTSDLGEDFHVYGLLWEADRIVWYLDGKELWSFTDRAAIASEPLYLIMNLAVGGVYPGPPAPRLAFPKSFLVDYVRIWQRKGG